MGTWYYVGDNKMEAVKLDIYYTDSFIREIYQDNNLRMAPVEEIVAMKIDIVSRGGRKKDFWDLHEYFRITHSQKCSRFIRNAIRMAMMQAYF